MRFTKSSLTVVNAAADDENRRNINCVHFAEDGSVVASDGQAMVVVSPLRQDLFRLPPALEEEEQGVPEDGMSVPINVVQEVLRNMPKALPAGEVSALTRADDLVEFATTDLRTVQRVSGVILQTTFPRWRRLFRRAGGNKTRARTCVSMRKLVELLVVLDAARGRDKNAPIFIEVGDEGDALLLRTMNRTTGQDVVAIINPLATRGGWPRLGQWARKLLGRQPTRLVRRRDRGESDAT